MGTVDPLAREWNGCRFFSWAFTLRTSVEQVCGSSFIPVRLIYPRRREQRALRFYKPICIGHTTMDVFEFNRRHFLSACM